MLSPWIARQQVTQQPFIVCSPETGDIMFDFMTSGPSLPELSGLDYSSGWSTTGEIDVRRRVNNGIDR